MKIRKVLPVAILFLMIPVVAFAFSWKDLLWWQNTNPAPAEKIRVLTQQQRLSVEEKFKNWDTAFKNKSWDTLLDNQNNLTITEEEINYMITKKIKEDKNSPIKNLLIKFQDDQIILSGYLLKPLEGNFTTTAEIISKDKEINLEIKKVRYKGIPFPKSITNILLSKAIDPITQFLYSYPNYQGVKIISDKGVLKIDYK